MSRRAHLPLVLHGRYGGMIQMLLGEVFGKTHFHFFAGREEKVNFFSQRTEIDFLI